MGLKKVSPISVKNINNDRTRLVMQKKLIKVNPSDSTITGSNTIRYKVIDEYNRMQIDLQNPMEIYKVIQDGVALQFKREGNAFFIELIAPQKVGLTNCDIQMN
mgnify:CR=1 FL=1